MRPARGIAGFAMCLVLCGCASTPTKQQPASITPGSQTIARDGFSADCPPGWKLAQNGNQYALAVVPKDATGSDDDPLVAIQKPPLPPHIPGFIPLFSVTSGYVDDLKKRYPDEKIDEQSAVKLDEADARRFVSSFKDNGKPWRELALLAVHDDHVYVITGNCEASAFDKTKTAFDALVASVKWTK
jgi:hypothetical protein